MEQKNSQYVRQFVGYARYDTTEEFEALREVYRVLCPLLNLFYPSTKLIAKHRENATIHKTYDTPQTPFSRVLASPFVSLTAKEQLPTSRKKDWLNIFQKRCASESLNTETGIPEASIKTSA